MNLVLLSGYLFTRVGNYDEIIVMIVSTMIVTSLQFQDCTLAVYIFLVKPVLLHLITINSPLLPKYHCDVAFLQIVFYSIAALVSWTVESQISQNVELSPFDCVSSGKAGMGLTDVVVWHWHHFILHCPFVHHFILHRPFVHNFILHHPFVHHFILHRPFANQFSWLPIYWKLICR